MHTLTDLQVLALLAAAPVDHAVNRGGRPAPGHVTPEERRAARDFLDPSLEGRAGRVVLARVFGLPVREPGDNMPLVMALAWGDVERVLIPREQIDRTLAALASASCTTGSIADRVEALVAEVLELRRVTATTIDEALERLREEASILEHAAVAAEHEAHAAAGSCSHDVPAKPLSYCAGPSCPGYPYAASSLAHPPSCNEPR